MEFISESPEQTKTIITKISPLLKGGDILLLYGDLGAGKTTITKYLAAEFGLVDNITSPTFVVVKNYTLPNMVRGVSEIIHMDAYRLRGAPDAESVGILEYLERKDILLIIEWPENIYNILPSDCKEIRIEHQNGDKRKIICDF